MIQKLQNIFHTDKWWGRLFLIASFYLIFLFFGYWVWFLFAKLEIIDSAIFIDKFIPAIIYLFILPISSFYLIFKIKKNFILDTNKIILFFINLLIILLNLFLFILVGVNLFMKPNFF